MNAMSDKGPSGPMFDELLEEAAPNVQISFKEFVAAYGEQLRLLAKILIIALPLTFIAVPVGMHLFGATTYTAEMTIAPNRTVNSMGDAGGGGLSSLIGLQGPTDSQFELYLATRKSNLLAAHMWSLAGFPQKIFAGFWDPETRQWKPNSGVFQTAKRALIRLMGFNDWTPPSPGDLAAYLAKAFTVETDKRTLITKITFSDSDPAFAKWLLATVHNQTEAILREQAQQRTRVMIDHAVHELSVVTVAEQRMALIALLSAQEKQLMMIGDNLPYAAVVVDPPSADLPDSAPRPLRNILIGLLVVTFLCALWLAGRVLLRLRREKKHSVRDGTSPAVQARRTAPLSA